MDCATHDIPEPMLRCGRLPPPPYFEAYLRDLAMHLVWCGCRSRLASPLVGGITTAVGSPAQGVLKALSAAPCDDPMSSRPGIPSLLCPLWLIRAVKLVSSVKTGVRPGDGCGRGPVLNEATVGIEPTMKVLQTSALPLGYVALYSRTAVFLVQVPDCHGSRGKSAETDLTDQVAGHHQQAVSSAVRRLRFARYRRRRAPAA